ncbi:MAG: hypothetical protein ABSH01_25155 [Terriglobia bacterium]|jgi:hypothetical protein
MNWIKALAIAVLLSASAWAQQTVTVPVTFSIDANGHVSATVTLPPAAYPGVTSCGNGCLQAIQLQTNGPPPNGISVGTTPGVTVVLTPAKTTCKITVNGGIITGATGC